MDYTNDPELNGKYLGTIAKNVMECSPYLCSCMPTIFEKVVLLELR